LVFERRVPIKTGHKSKPNHSYHKNKNKHDKTKGLLTNLITIILGLGIVVFLLILSYFIFLWFTTADVSIISKTIPNETTKIYSSDGIMLADMHKEENRIIVPFSQINMYMKKAVVALEDARFYKHHGIDPIGIVRATVVNTLKGEKAQGASTITQQLARHLFLYKKKVFVRKIQEIVLAIKIERQYTKDEILEMYLNQVYWGHNAYGIESASLQYFDKHAVEINIAESAVLAGMLKAPEYFSPFRNPEAAIKRKDVVLQRMYKTHLITRAQYLESKKTPVVFASRKKLKYKAPYFTGIIVDKLVQMYGEEAAYNSGLKVMTPLNYKMQLAAEAAVDYAIQESNVASLNFSQAAILSLDTSTGYVLSLVGGYDYLRNQFNKVTQARRQPGSSFKPFVYLTALAKGISPGSIFSDSPVAFNTIVGPYAPQNYDKTYDGRMPLRHALQKSKNVVAVKIISMVRPEAVIETARLFGITTPLQPYLSIALGTQEVSMLELTAAYGALANGGILYKPIFIQKIEDRNGTVIYRENIQGTRIYDSNLIYTLVEMMKSVVEAGTGQAAKLPRPMAGKTGTTSDFKDAWFVGFVPQMAVSTWVGNDNGRPMYKVTGGTMPALMWKEYMKEALNNIPPIEFPSPEGLTPVNICWTSGKVATPYCPQTSVEKFWNGHVPGDNCDVHSYGGVSHAKPAPVINENSSKKSEAIPETPENKESGWIKEFLNE